MTIQQEAPSIILENIYLNYKEQRIFRDLNFILSQGQITCLLGSSGVGKSTLLRLIAGLLTCPNQIHQIKANDGLPLAGRIGFLTQQDGLMPWLTVSQNIFLSFKLQGLKVTATDQAKAEQLLTEVGLIDYQLYYPRQLSLGMRQRVALVRTYLEDKMVILMDEPFSSLDIVTRMHLQQLTLQLFRQKTVLLVTHDPLEALRMAHRVHVMYGVPAQISDAIILPSTPPRALNDPNLVPLQNKIMQLLTPAEEIL